LAKIMYLFFSIAYSFIQTQNLLLQLVLSITLVFSKFIAWVFLWKFQLLENDALVLFQCINSISEIILHESLGFSHFLH
jgi:hypothetical protein